MKFLGKQGAISDGTLLAVGYGRIRPYGPLTAQRKGEPFAALGRALEKRSRS